MISYVMVRRMNHQKNGRGLKPNQNVGALVVHANLMEILMFTISMETKFH